MDAGISATAKPRSKRNKRNKFLRNAKGFGKKGIFGRGSHLDDDQYTYFLNILDSMHTDHGDVEDTVTKANNVFETTLNQEVHLASNQIVSRVLESLIGYADAANLERFFDAFAESFRPICTDPFASHVLQKMVEIAFLRGVCKAAEGRVLEEARPAKKQKSCLLEQYNMETEFVEEHREVCRQFVERVGKFVLNNLEDFVWHTTANHVIRTCVLCLAGIYAPKEAFEKGCDDLKKISKVYVVPLNWWAVMKEYPERLEMWPQFADFPFQEHSSALLGVICISLEVVNKTLLKHFGRKILQSFLTVSEDNDKNKTISDEQLGKVQVKIEKTETLESDDNIKLPRVFECQSSVRLLETLLTVAGPKLFTQLSGMLFAGRFAVLASNQLANFAVQKLVLNIKAKDDFHTAFCELSGHIEDLLRIGRTGVVEALSKACLRLSTNQAQMIVVLQKALHAPISDKERAKIFFQCLVKLKPYEETIEDKSAFVHLHGSLIVQHILKYNKPIFLVNCILGTSPDKLALIFNTPNGSHITDAYLQSNYIGESSREKLIRHLEGYYVDLAVTRPGSRVIENFFEASKDSQKERIVRELTDRVNFLLGTPFGRILHSKLRLETYKLSAAKWKAGLSIRENKAAELFKDIIS